MKFNLWRQMRLAGGVLMVVGSYINRIDMIVIAFTIVMIGTVNGLASIENRVTALEPKEEKPNEKTEA